MSKNRINTSIDEAKVDSKLSPSGRGENSTYFFSRNEKLTFSIVFGMEENHAWQKVISMNFLYNHMKRC